MSPPGASGTPAAPRQEPSVPSRRSLSGSAATSGRFATSRSPPAPGQQRPHGQRDPEADEEYRDRKSTRLNSSHTVISYAVFCLKKKKKEENNQPQKKQS